MKRRLKAVLSFWVAILAVMSAVAIVFGLLSCTHPLVVPIAVGVLIFVSFSYVIWKGEDED